MKSIRTMLLVIAVSVVAFTGQRALAQQAQSNPDFSNVNDILQGNRTLFQITDLQVSVSVPNRGIGSYRLETSNSSVTKTSLVLTGLGSFPFKSFSGWMFNQPQATTVTEANHANKTFSQTLITQNIPSTRLFSLLALVAPDVFTPGVPPALITAGAMADFNQDGYDDFAFSFDYKGSIRIATACDVNNPNNDSCRDDAGQPSVLKFGPRAFVGDRLNDMTAGDFDGDGQPEIAGLSIMPNGGLKLVIYAV